MGSQKHIEIHRIWELGLCAKPAILKIKIRSDLLKCTFKICLTQVICQRINTRHRPQVLVQPIRRICDIITFFPIMPGNGFQNLGKARYVVPALRRKIRAAVKRDTLRRQKHAHRPPTGTGHNLYRIHINFIHIGAFFPIDLHVDKMRIHNLRDFLIFKTLVLHHMTPVTGCISHAQKNGLVFGNGLLKRLFSPRKPRNGIVCMLQ